jgi:hypothetical protein
MCAVWPPAAAFYGSQSCTPAHTAPYQLTPACLPSVLLGVHAASSLCSGCSSVGFLVNGQLDIQHGLAFGITNLLVRTAMHKACGSGRVLRAYEYA